MPSRPRPRCTCCSNTAATSSARPRSWPWPGRTGPEATVGLDVLPGFVGELRAAGLPVSLIESIDAAEAVHHIPLEDREALKYALAATLVKSSSHWKAFETAFEVYFSMRGPQYEIDDDAPSGDADADAESDDPRRGEGKGHGGSGGEGLSPEELAEML